MESKNRNVWVIVAVIAVLACCAVVVLVAVAAVAWLNIQPVGLFGGTGRVLESSDQVYAVGEAPSLVIDSFAGDVTVRAGASGTVRVRATKQARRQSDLDRIQLTISERDAGLLITAKKDSSFTNASVDLEITAPAGTRLQVDTGAGEVVVDGIEGEIVIDSGAGDVHLTGVSGPVGVNTGAGGINYSGTPRGECRFDTGAGDIRLALPGDVAVGVDLSTGIGNVDVAFAVAGQVGNRDVQGTIGSGAQGDIFAHTGAGDIDVTRR